MNASSFRSMIALVSLSLLIANASLAPGEDLVAEGAKVEKLAGDFKFTEGPARDKEGNVYFTDIPNERIHKWSIDGKLSVFREKSGRANGLFFDADGNLVACEGGAFLVGESARVQQDGTHGTRSMSKNSSAIRNGADTGFSAGKLLLNSSCHHSTGRTQ